jgi:hypothetical protein
VGTPDDAVLNGVRAIGKATVVHYSIEIGDDPGGVALPAEPVERCLTEGGFSSG